MEIAVTVWRNTAYVDQLISFKFLSAWQWTSPAQMVGQSQETVQRLSGMSMETEGFFWQKLISAVPRDDLVINYSWNIKQPGRINGLSNEMVIWYFTVYKWWNATKNHTDLSDSMIGYPNWISEQRCRFIMKLCKFDLE